MRCINGHYEPATGDCILPHGSHEDGCPKTRHATTGAICGWHDEQLTTSIDEIKLHWRSLNLILLPGTTPIETTARGGKSKADPPAPANLEVLSLRDRRSGSAYDELPSVPAVIAAWVVEWDDERRLTETHTELVNGVTVTRERRLTLPRGVLAQLDLLARHQTWIVGRPWVDDYITELNQLRRALKHALRDRETTEMGRCLYCDTNLVERSNAVICPGCHEKWVSPQEKARLSVAQSA
jgi:hypothetical protein